MWVESQTKRGSAVRLSIILNISVLFIIIRLNAGTAVEISNSSEQVASDGDLQIQMVRDRSSIPRVPVEHDGMLSNKLKLSEGKWLTYFPHIAQMIKCIENMTKFPSLEETTSPYHTAVTLKNKSIGFIGETIIARIQAKDHLDRPKRYGGDYFRVSMNRCKYDGDDGVTCGVVDHSDGTYTTRCRLLWQGRACLQVMLVHPSELIYLIIVNTNRRSDPGLIMNTTFLNSHGEIEYGICDVDLSDRLKSSEICDHTHLKTGEPYFCAKPASGECNPPLEQMDRIVTKQAKNITGTTYFKHCEEDCYKAIKNSGITVEIKGVMNETKILLPCNLISDSITVPLDPSEPTGYIFERNWRTFHCNNSHGLESRFKICLSDHSVYVMGDSTLTAWFRSIARSFKVQLPKRSNDRDWSPRDVDVIPHNADIHYSSHGPPFHGAGPTSSRRYIVDSLDGIQYSTRPIVVMFSIGIHFGRLHPDLFLRRVRSIKEAVKRLLERLNNVRVFVLGLHSSRPWLYQMSPWVAYRLEVILRSEFGDNKEVTFLPFWDMLVKMGNNSPHPFGRYMNQKQGLFLSYACEAQV